MAANGYQAGLVPRREQYIHFPTIGFMTKRFNVKVMYLDSLLLILRRDNGSWELYTTDSDRRIGRTSFSAIGHGKLTYYIASRNSPVVESLHYSLLTRRAAEAKVRLFND